MENKKDTHKNVRLQMYENVTRLSINLNAHINGSYLQYIKQQPIWMYHLSSIYQLITKLISEIINQPKNVWLAHRKSNKLTTKNKIHRKCKTQLKNHMPSHNTSVVKTYFLKKHWRRVKSKSYKSWNILYQVWNEFC